MEVGQRVKIVDAYMQVYDQIMSTEWFPDRVRDEFPAIAEDVISTACWKNKDLKPLKGERAEFVGKIVGDKCGKEGIEHSILFFPEKKCYIVIGRRGYEPIDDDVPRRDEPSGGSRTASGLR